MCEEVLKLKTGFNKFITVIVPEDRIGEINSVFTYFNDHFKSHSQYFQNLTDGNFLSNIYLPIILNVNTQQLPADLSPLHKQIVKEMKLQKLMEMCRIT